MSVASDSEENQVKARETVGIHRQVSAKQLLVPIRGGLEFRLLSFHPMDVSGRHRNVLEQFVPGHAEVAFRMIHRHGAFIAPIQAHPRPVDLGAEFVRRQQTIQFPRRVAARQCDREYTFTVVDSRAASTKYLAADRATFALSEQITSSERNPLRCRLMIAPLSSIVFHQFFGFAGTPGARGVTT